MSSERVHILLVEDNQADVYLFRKAFEAAELNFELTALHDGASAIAFIQGEDKYAGCSQPDLIVLDLNLPKYDGGQVLRAIQHAGRFEGGPVVIASSLPRLNLADDEELSVTRYIHKPFSLDEFLKVGVTLKQVLLASKGGNECTAHSAPRED